MDMHPILDIIYKQNCNLPSLLDNLNTYFINNFRKVDLVSLNLIDKELLNEIKSFSDSYNVNLYFGNTLRTMKCVITDDNWRDHEIYLLYEGPKIIKVLNAKLPHSPLIGSNYNCLENIVNTFKEYIQELSCYFNQLELLDKNTAVVEPVNPSFKDNYRKIYLDERTWLHVEVTTDGVAVNIHVVGNSTKWHNKLQSGLLLWDHDEDIVKNILKVFELPNFSFPLKIKSSEEVDDISGPTCGICLCSQLPDITGLPQPLCKNLCCQVHFHRDCLYQWLIADVQNPRPVFGIATGSCPNCFHAIECNEKDF